MGTEIRLLIVEDHDVFRAGLHAIIESLPGYRIVAETDSVRDSYGLIQTSEFDMLLVDVSLPGTSGLALIREMRRLKRTEPILVLTMHDAPAVAAEALAAGANGFALKSDSRATVLEAIVRVSRGHRYVSPTMPQATIEGLLQRRGRGSIAGALAPLSVREREIFDLFVRGFENDQIARELCISTKTVETHRGHIFVKLNVHSMAELVRFAFQHQLAAPELPSLGNLAPERTAG